MSRLFIYLILTLSLSFCAGNSLVMKEGPESCKGSAVGQAGVLDQKFTDGKLQVRTFARFICAGTKLSGNYRIINESLIIRYSEKLDGPATKCRCVRQFEHEIALKKEPKEIIVEID